MVSLSLKAAPQAFICCILYSKYKFSISSDRDQSRPAIPTVVLQCCERRWVLCQQARVQHVHVVPPASPSPVQCVRERMSICTYACHWGTWQECVEQRGRPKWRLFCRDQAWWPPRLVPSPTSVPSRQAEGS